MTTVVRAALTETINAYGGMPASVDDLEGLADRLDDIRAANVEHHVELMRAARDHDVRVIGFGELFTGPYFALDKRPLWHAMAEDAFEGPTVTRLREEARALGLIVVAPIYELERSTGKRFDTAVVIDERGEVLGVYRKTHIPQGRNEQHEFFERFYYDHSFGNPPDGAYFPVFETSAGVLGVAICYDRHFEGVIACLAEAGAQIVFSPAVTFGAKSERLWKHEFLVDAARHRVFIGGSNRRGSEAPWGQPYFGDSHFAGMDGARLENVSDHPNLIIADLDLSSLTGDDISGWDLEHDRRPAIYR